MRFSELRKLVQQLVTDGGGGGGGALDLEDVYEVPDASAYAGTTQMPNDPTVSNVIVAQFNVGTHGVSIVTDTITLITLPGQEQGYVTIQAEIPPNTPYATISDGISSAINAIIEVPRR